MFVGSAARITKGVHKPTLKSQQPEDVSSESEYTDPASALDTKGTAYVPHIDVEMYSLKGHRFNETKLRIRRELANGLRAAFPRIRSLVTAFQDEEGFVRNGIVFCGGEHDHQVVGSTDPLDPTLPNQFRKPDDFSPLTGSLSLIDGWSSHKEYDGGEQTRTKKLCTYTSGVGCVSDYTAAAPLANDAAHTACTDLVDAAATCVEAATTSVTDDATACAAVSDLTDNTACLAVNTTAGATGACTYTAAVVQTATSCAAKRERATWNVRESTQCDKSNCTEGSFVNIVSRFIRAHGYHVQHNDICQATALHAPAINARTCLLEKYTTDRVAYRCDRNASNNAQDWWQINKQCYGLSEVDCTDKCAWDSIERFCRASETYMDDLVTDGECKKDTDETIPKDDNYLNEIWRVLGYSVQSDVKAVPTTDKAVVTGSKKVNGKTECKTPRAFINALNGNAQVNAFRDLGIEEAVAQWFEELKGVRSYLTSLSALLVNFYPTTLTMFPFIENEELDECPMGDVVRNPNTDSGSEAQPLCEQVDFQTYDKLNRINEAGQSMLRSTCFCRNGDLDGKFSGIDWTEGTSWDKDSNEYSSCTFKAAVAEVTGVSASCNPAAGATNTNCAAAVANAATCSAATLGTCAPSIGGASHCTSASGGDTEAECDAKTYGTCAGTPTAGGTCTTGTITEATCEAGCTWTAGVGANLCVFTSTNACEFTAEIPSAPASDAKCLKGGAAANDACEAYDGSTSGVVCGFTAGVTAVDKSCLDSSGAVDDACTAADADEDTCIAATASSDSAACVFTAAVPGVTEECDDGTGASNACNSEASPSADQCETHTIANTIPADASVCSDLRTGKFERYSVHEFDQIYLEEDPDVWAAGNSNFFDCNRFKDLLPSVYTYCTNMKVWGDTATWERSLKMVKPNKDRIKVRKGSAASATKDEIYSSLIETLPVKENKCGRVVTAHNESSLAIISNKGGNCVPFEKLHEIMYRVEFETSDAEVGKVANEDVVYVEA